MKTEITSCENVYEYVKQYTNVKVTKNRSTYKNYDFTIHNATFKDTLFTKELKYIRFNKCKFVDCTFEGLLGFFLILKNCKFENCYFRNTRISHIYYSWEIVEFNNCTFINVKIDESGFMNVFFENCYFTSFSLIDFNPVWNVHFTKCYIENSQCESIIRYSNDDEIDFEAPDILFENCEIVTSTFLLTDLRNSFFVDTKLYKTGFIDCRLGSQSFSSNTNDISINSAFADFHTILNSENIPKKILKQTFGITDNNIKKSFQRLTTKEYKSVFISYSLRDSQFAKLLNKELNLHGISTFLWDEDAPAGEKLNNIMASNIRVNEMFIFISSKHSLISNACHFELSESIKKRGKRKIINIIPLHLDNTLFEITENQLQALYNPSMCWNSICELRQINSIDVTKFANYKRRSSAFKEMVIKIIEKLKKI